MDKKGAIQFLKEKLGEIPTLAKLPYKNQEYPLWCNQIDDVLEEVFSRDSTEYKRFFGAFVSVSIPGEGQRLYQEELELRHTAVLSIIKKYERLGIERETVPEPEIPVSPVTLYDAMSLHPRVVEASRGLFKDEYYSDAIFRAFTAVSNFVKEKSGLSLDGKALMSAAFNEEKPVIKINDLLTKSDRDEQEGFKFLFMGATVGIRNPKAHDLIVMKDPYRTLEYLAFASLLLKKIDFWEISKFA